MKFDPYKTLALQVTVQAVRDYRENWMYRKAVRDFVNSPSFDILCTDLFTRSQILRVLDTIDEEVKK